MRGPGAAIDQAGEKGEMSERPPKLPSEKGAQEIPGEFGGTFQLMRGLSQGNLDSKVRRQGNWAVQFKSHKNGPHSRSSVNRARIVLHLCRQAHRQTGERVQDGGSFLS